MCPPAVGDREKCDARDEASGCRPRGRTRSPSPGAEATGHRLAVAELTAERQPEEQREGREEDHGTADDGHHHGHLRVVRSGGLPDGQAL